MNWETILFERDQADHRIGYLTINRPEVHNALNSQVFTDLEELLAIVKKDDTLKIIIVKGAGHKAFVAGADIKDFAKVSSEEGYLASRRVHKIFDDFEMLDQIVIAAVNGVALGGGCELALACDLRIATKRSKFGLPETSLGIIPGYGGTQRLPRMIGKAAAKELVFTAEIITAQRAYELGMLNRVVETEEDLLPACLEMAGKILKNGPHAVARGKQAINEGMEMDLRHGEAHESTMLALCFAGEEFKEGTAAFIEKRKPDFSKCSGK